MPLVLPHQLLSSQLSRYDISGSIVPDGFAPSVQLNISYGGKNISAGDKLTKEETAQVPQVSFLDTDDMGPGEKASYTLVLMDPDAPSKADPKYGPWRHWIQPSFKPIGIHALAESVPRENGGNQTMAPEEAGTMPLVKSEAPSVTPYLGPGPPPGSGPHRYIFLLYREPEGYEANDKDVIGNEFTQRRNWDWKGFVERKGLKLVGATFFIVDG